MSQHVNLPPSKALASQIELPWNGGEHNSSKPCAVMSGIISDLVSVLLIGSKTGEEGRLSLGIGHPHSRSLKLIPYWILA